MEEKSKMPIEGLNFDKELPEFKMPEPMTRKHPDLEAYLKKQPKLNFEQLTDLTDSSIRMEMIQLGLNPFNPEDITHYKQIQSEGKGLTFFKRFKAAWTLLFSNTANEDLEIFVMKKINAKISKSMDTVLSTPGEFKKFSSEFTKMVLDAPASGFSNSNEGYKDELKKTLEKRMSATTTGDFNYPNHPLEVGDKINIQYIPIEPDKLFTVVEGKKGYLESLIPFSIKPPSKKRSSRKKIVVEEGTKLPGVHRGSGDKVKVPNPRNPRRIKGS